MTWQNLPCAPTLPALFAACPHGWAEIEFTYQAGNPTADPPQDADCSIGFGRVWGVDHEDLRGGPCRPPVLDHDVLLDLREPPLGVPHRDFVLLARVIHRAGPCNMCGRKRRPDEQGWSCFAGDWDAEPLACPGTFPFECVLETCWGVDGKPVVFIGAMPIYGLAAALDHKAATTRAPAIRDDEVRCACGCLFVVADYDGICPRCSKTHKD